MKQKKDRIFVIVLGIVLANLAYQLAGVLMHLTAQVTSIQGWAVLTANVIAIAGVLWLLRSYRKGRKFEKAKEAQEITTKEE
jgi:type VI protein secretion system component VasK